MTLLSHRAAAWRGCKLQQKKISSNYRLVCRAQQVRFPAEQASKIVEQAAIDMMEQARLVELEVPTLGLVQTAMVGPERHSPDGRPTFVLLHGFDSSFLEMRRLYPLISQLGDTYAVDLAGWGFTDIGAVGNPDLVLGPQQKREHLRAFCAEVLGGRPVVLVGTSLGGTIAMDFALHYPEAVQSLVLVDPQGFIDGLGLLPKLPRFLLELGCKVLQSDWLRDSANQMAYYDKTRCATEDARRICQLHTSLPGWVNANISFMRSGGYAISHRIKDVEPPALILWGRQDEILDPQNADRFLQELPHAQLVWIEECGHCAHLEQPQVLMEAVAAFVGRGQEAGGRGRALQAAAQQ